MTDFEPFPWTYLEERLAEGFEAFWPSVLEMLQDEYGEQARACPQCGLPANELTWIPVVTCDESWEEDHGQVGYLTVCFPCRHQVDFLLEPELTRIEAETREVTGGSTFGVTWKR